MSFLGRNKKKNAFDVLMKTAHKPGAFDLILNDDPWNEISGVDSLSCRPWDSLNHYHHKGQYDYDPAFQQAMRMISDATYKNTTLDRESFEESGQSRTDYFLSSFHNHDNCHTDDDDNDTGNNMNDYGVEPLPPPATSPLAGSEVVKLTVCFGRSNNELKNGFVADRVRKHVVIFSEYWRQTTTECNEYEDVRPSERRPIVGFIIEYSDGVEIEVGTLKGSFWEATLCLSESKFPNDSIRRILLQPDDDLNNHNNYDEDDFIDGYGVDSYDDNVYRLPPITPHADYGYSVYSKLCVETNNETYFVFEHGKVMPHLGGGSMSWNYGISNRKQKKKGRMETELSKLVVTPRGGGRYADDNYAAERPKKKQRRAFFNDAVEVEEKSSEDFACHEEVQLLMEEFHHDLSRICGSAQKALLDWYLNNKEGRLTNLEEIQIETDRVRYGQSDLEDELSRKKRCRRLNELCARTASVLKITDSEREDLEQLSLKLIRGAKFHLSVQLRAYQPRITQVNESIRQKTICKAIGNNALVCATSRSVFNPIQVRNRKRCSVPGCFDRNYNCGCTVWDCAICEEPFCHRHRATHRKSCEEKHKICSWKKYDESSDDDVMDYEQLDEEESDEAEGSDFYYLEED